MKVKWQRKARKFIKLKVPDFNGNADPELATTYLRLGATEVDEPVAAPDPQSADYTGNYGDPQVVSHVDQDRDGHSTGDDLASLVTGFYDDDRERGGDVGGSVADKFTTEADAKQARKDESDRLHSRGGWRDHTDGNRITTTRGDKVEVIGGNYRMMVLGRQSQGAGDADWKHPNDGAAWYESSGGLNRDDDNSPGSIVEIRWEEREYTPEAFRTQAEWDAEEWQSDPGPAPLTLWDTMTPEEQDAMENPPPTGDEEDDGNAALAAAIRVAHAKSKELPQKKYQWMVREETVLGDVHSYSTGYTFESHHGKKVGEHRGDVKESHWGDVDEFSDNPHKFGIELLGSAETFKAGGSEIEIAAVGNVLEVLACVFHTSVEGPGLISNIVLGGEFDVTVGAAVEINLAANASYTIGTGFESNLKKTEVSTTKDDIALLANKMMSALTKIN